MKFLVINLGGIKILGVAKMLEGQKNCWTNIFFDKTVRTKIWGVTKMLEIQKDCWTKKIWTKMFGNSWTVGLAITVHKQCCCTQNQCTVHKRNQLIPKAIIS